MNTPLATPVRQAKLGLASRSSPIASEYKKLLSEQYQRLWTKHQQDLELIDDIRSYVKTRLSIERDYSSSLAKLAKQHSSHISKKFILLDQCEPNGASLAEANTVGRGTRDLSLSEAEASDSRLQKRLANSGLADEPETACTLYRVWAEHINRLQSTTKNRAEQFEQLIMVVDKLKDIRSHKTSIGKKCLDTHLKQIHEDIIASMIDLDKAKKLYHEDESQAKKARENEEKIRKKRTSLLTKFTDLQAKKEKTLAQREATDIQSTQARNDYIMALAAANAHLQHYFNRDLNDFIQIIDDGCLDHCKIFMATLSECDVNSLKESLSNAQYWYKMINITGSHKTNSIFLECDQSACLRNKTELPFEPCNNDPIQTISLDHNADHALQYDVDKWFTWFKKECRNLSHLNSELDACQRALAEGQKTIELNGRNSEDLEGKIIELKQQIRKSEASKLKVQARLRAMKEGGMPIHEWSAVEEEIRADMAKAQEELAAAQRSKETMQEVSRDESDRQDTDFVSSSNAEPVRLHISRGSNDSDIANSSLQNLAPVSRSTSNYEQQNLPASGYSAFTDPSLVWQDDPNSAWGNSQSNYNVVVTDSYGNRDKNQTETDGSKDRDDDYNRYDLLSASNQQAGQSNQQQAIGTSMTVQSSSPLSAIVDGGGQSSPSMYPGMMAEAYKSDYECDYNRGGNPVESNASSVDPFQRNLIDDQYGNQTYQDSTLDPDADGDADHSGADPFSGQTSAFEMLNKRVKALYAFDKTNDDDLAIEPDDILRVIEINDSDWLRAIKESTCEEGYIPTSYVKLLEEEKSEVVGGFVDQGQRETEIIVDEGIEEPTSVINIETSLDKPQENLNLCRALYDYEPETGTYEEDGLPHLSLTQGELLKVIGLDEVDGWWLVERESSGERGHVPSMLVEEVDGEDEPVDEDEDDDLSGYSYEGDLDNSIKAMPTIEPPTFVAHPPPEDDPVETDRDQNNNVPNNNLMETKLDIDGVYKEKANQFSEQIISEAIGFAFGLKSDSSTNLI